MPTHGSPLQVRVSFEASRLGPQHLIEAYVRLVPTVRRTNLRPKAAMSHHPK